MTNDSSSTTAVSAPFESDATGKASNRKPKATLAKVMSLPPVQEIDVQGLAAAESAPPPDAVVGKASKQDIVLSLLRRPEGVTLAAMIEVTGWQAHSVRGFLSGTARKKLGLSLISETVGGHRHYRIDGGAA